MNTYEPLKLTLIMLENTDVITGSNEDNIGGPGDWED